MCVCVIHAVVVLATVSVGSVQSEDCRRRRWSAGVDEYGRGDGGAAGCE